MNKKKDLELYIHIPFCIRKCKYCDFISGPETKEVIDTYYHSLLTEIENYGNGNFPIWNYQVKTIFIGGGTPSSIDSSYIKGIMEKINKVFLLAPKDKMEITIEANPGTLSKEKLTTYRSLGINRLSLGLQSANNEELKLLGRIHTMEEFMENYALARECGFNNINIDLMSALPGQTIDSWKNTLTKVLELKPEHISAYSLIIEEGTPFYDTYENHEELLPDEDTEREMYRLTKRMLYENGYTRYEISNYAKEGYSCQHNLGYWERTPYLGLGLSAASLFENERFKNPTTQTGYNNYVEKNNTGREIEILNAKTQMEEFMFLGFRKMKGVSKIEFDQNFSIPMKEVYKDVIEELAKEKLLEESQNYIYLTERGIDISNYVLAKFLLDEE